MIQPERRVHRAPTAVWRKIDDQVAILSIDQNRVRLLNEVGGFVWSRCDGMSVDEIGRAVAQHFAVSAEQASRDVEQFLADLVGRGLLTVDG